MIQPAAMKPMRRARLERGFGAGIAGGFAESLDDAPPPPCPEGANAAASPAALCAGGVCRVVEAVTEATDRSDYLCT